ncbi:MAG: DMT family transporter [Chloroflexi bacterium]|nr:DMT family transporter [Chloroflexota bacterium]MDA1240501.1 DMT family transporter [Chloroflexota bacterium]
MRPLHLGALVLIALIWGASFMLIKIMLEGMTPVAVGWTRLGGGALLICTVAAARRPSIPRSFSHWRDVTAIAIVASAIPMVLFPWAEQSIPSNLAAILNGATPIWAAILTVAFLPAERMTASRLLGVLLGFIGLAVIIGADGLDIRSASTQGQLAVLLAAFGYACGAIITRRRLLGADSILLAGSQNAIAFLLLTPYVIFNAEVPDFASLGGRVLIASAALAFLGQGVAIMIYFWLLKNVEATQVALVTYLAPVAAIGWGWMVLQERLELVLIPGLALILGGMLLANRRPRPVPIEA